MKASSIEGALFGKEWRRFVSSPNNMLNCSLGTVFMLVLMVAALIYCSQIRSIIEMMGGMEKMDRFLPVAVTVMVCVMVPMNDLTALPSCWKENRFGFCSLC